MRVFCGLPNGLVLHNDAGGVSVPLRHGSNEVDDDFAKAWFALHDGAENKSSLVVDGLVYIMNDVDTETDDAEAEAKAPKVAPYRKPKGS
jgi:hypothetical protein